MKSHINRLLLAANILIFGVSAANSLKREKALMALQRS
jgi:hypothetical protein